MNKKILLIALIFIVSCSFLQQQNQTETEPTKKSTPSALKTEPAKEEVLVVVSCEESGVPMQERGKVTLTYSNGQKESSSDSCLEDDEPAFKSFKIHYYCENLTVKSNLYNCQSEGNLTCDRGSCI